MTALRAPRRPVGVGPRLCQVPALALDDPDLTPADLRTLLALGRFTDAAGYCWPGQKELAEIFGEVTRQAISKRILRLVRLGWVEKTERRTPRGSQITNGYRVRFDMTPDQLDVIFDRRAEGLDEADPEACQRKVDSAEDGDSGPGGAVDKSAFLSTESCGGATSKEVAGAQPHGSCAIERTVNVPINEGARARENRDGEKGPVFEAVRTGFAAAFGEDKAASWIDRADVAEERPGGTIVLTGANPYAAEKLGNEYAFGLSELLGRPVRVLRPDGSVVRDVDAKPRPPP